MRMSHDLRSQGGNRYTTSLESADQSSKLMAQAVDNNGSAERRRNLRTAGGVGFVNLQNELLDKGIMYKARQDHTAKLEPRNRLGKSTDATHFRRSIVFNGGVL